LEIDSLPSATTLLLQRRRAAGSGPVPATKRAAILADPVFSSLDSRLSLTDSARSGSSEKGGAGARVPPSPKSPRPVRPASNPPLTEPDLALRGAALQAPFERLPASRREADAIAALAPPGEVWIARDFAATRDVVLSGALNDYKVIHFATHAVADTRTPELSGLVFSQVDEAGRPREGFLGLADIYDLRLTADLVVLSGCRTAFGREVRGEGLMGLTRAFLYAGVPRVVASLWPVQDRAAAELMSRFYRALWREKKSPSTALREAQRALRRDPRYRDSFYWAGYVLQGDWR
jgi:CHAT domain-containing protein